MYYIKRAFLLLFVVFLAGCGVTTRDAEHTGFITAVEKNGLIWPTGRVYVKTDLSSSQEDRYCVEDEKIYNQLKQKAKNKESLTLVYKDEAFVAPWRCESESGIITGIK
jgi:hypothetical protein